jgi:universal stress protein A
MKTEEMPVRLNAGGFSLKRILVPVDFSPLSRKAVDYVIRFAKEFQAELSLVHVLEPEIPPTYDGYMIPAATSDSNGAATNERNQFKTLVNSVRAAGVEKVDSMIRRGPASHEIVDVARDLEVDLIVIATHGHTGWKHFCIGSTAERVVRAAPCPVLVVRQREHEFITMAAYGGM